MSRTTKVTVSTTMEGIVTAIVETMTGTNMTTPEALMIIVKAMTNRAPMSEAW